MSWLVSSLPSPNCFKTDTDHFVYSAIVFPGNKVADMSMLITMCKKCTVITSENTHICKLFFVEYNFILSRKGVICMIF